MKNYNGIVWLCITLTLVLLLGVCAPETAPSPVIASTTAAQAQPSTTSPTELTPKEDALSKLIEAARKEGRVNVYSYAFIGDTGLAIAKGFKDRYNIPVDIITGRGSEFVERVKTERRAGIVTADLTEFSLVHSTNLKLAGATASTLDIPALKEKGVWRIEPLAGDPEGHLLAFRTQIVGPYYNTKLVKPDEVPTSYKDFLNPKWAGKIVGPDPNFTGGPYQLLIPLLDDKKLDLDTIKALGKTLSFVQGTRQVAEALARSEYALGLTTTDLDAGIFLSEGAPIKAIAAKEGVAALISTMARINGGPHPNAAKLFMNWMLLPEGQSIYTKATSTAPLRKDVKDARHPDSIVDVPLYAEGYEMAQKTSKLYADKYFVELWRK